MFLSKKKRGFKLIRRKGFTLIELLVSVAIFSGIVVLALGAFARSADSSIKSSAVRERTEAARTVVDRIANDMQYVYLEKEFNAGINECNTSQSSALGVNFSDNCLAMLLDYPDSDLLVLKRYIRLTQNSRESIHLEEARNCQIAGGNVLECSPERSFFAGDIINGKYSIAKASDSLFAKDALFGGIAPFTAKAQNTTPIIEVNVVVKPSIYSGTCSEDPSQCYVIKSSFVPGA